MAHDLIIRNGTVIDGTGGPAQRADVAIDGDRITAIGDLAEVAATREIDARGMVVTPGFVDLHTHLDAQIAWDPMMTSSSWHGVTTVLMGNCGVTFAPVRPQDRTFLAEMMESVEDIPRDTILGSLPWDWETFPEYLDTLDRLPKGINYAGYVGHSALRTWAMGERAFEEQATPDDLEVMARELRDAMRAGAIGFTTSRTFNHQTSDDRPVASRVAAWDEVAELVRVMGRTGAGIFEIAGEDVGRDADRQRQHDARQHQQQGRRQVDPDRLDDRDVLAVREAEIEPRQRPDVLHQLQPDRVVEPVGRAVAEGDEVHALQTHWVGHYNVSNVLGVIASLRALGHGLSDAVQACRGLPAVPGRMQTVGELGEPLVVVDYAHTPDAVAHAVQALLHRLKR